MRREHERKIEALLLKRPMLKPTSVLIVGDQHSGEPPWAWGEVQTGMFRFDTKKVGLRCTVIVYSDRNCSHEQLLTLMSRNRIQVLLDEEGAQQKQDECLKELKEWVRQNENYTVISQPFLHSLRARGFLFPQEMVSEQDGNKLPQMHLYGGEYTDCLCCLIEARKV